GSSAPADIRAAAQYFISSYRYAEAGGSPQNSFDVVLSSLCWASKVYLRTILRLPPVGQFCRSLLGAPTSRNQVDAAASFCASPVYCPPGSAYRMTWPCVSSITSRSLSFLSAAL